jgi:hypothetical protein
MLDVRFAHSLQTLFLDELREAREPRPHVFRQGLDLRVNGFIRGLDRPTHVLIYQKRHIPDAQER